MFIKVKQCGVPTDLDTYIKTSDIMHIQRLENGDFKVRVELLHYLVTDSSAKAYLDRLILC